MFLCSTALLHGSALGLHHVPHRNHALAQVGAEVIPGDRDARTTIQRYLWKTRYLTYKNAGKMQKPGAPLHIGRRCVTRTA